MPRGVANPEVRQQLFAAVETVILRDGAAGLRGRAITGEAEVATGLLYAHFSDLDALLVGYLVDRSFTIAATAKTSVDPAGRGAVVDQLVGTLLAAPTAATRAVARLAAARPDVAAEARSVLGDGNVGIEAIATAATDHLTAQRRLGRIDDTADVTALAEVVAGVFHHLVLTAPDTELAPRMRRAVAATLAGATTPTPT